ncbi:DUF3179 domain-containing protein [Fodinicurvata sp. EGI_FJ10296]|uniref:DUF3179 domain-containing protein n=1 Tax=Fodinicurvata sp. EGI_FJ10296 TaxID=3231908 RepID=UPI0034549D6E
MPTRRTVLSGILPLLVVASAPASVLAAVPRYPVSGTDRHMGADAQSYWDAKMSGGPGKDGIPAIDNPRFHSAAEADSWLAPDDVVFGLVENGVVRAYPQRILVWHEIVNDTVGGDGIAVTYCPLTGTAIAFERGGTEFGVTGQLVNSNLIMYDRDTDTWYPQILMRGIGGPHAGASLRERALLWTTWGRWRSAHPETGVLSTDTGFARNYDRDPYGGYNPISGYYVPDSETMFPLMNTDDRFANKQVFIGARTDRVAMAFNLDSLRAARRLVLEAGDEVFTAVYDEILDTGYVFIGETAGEAVINPTGPHAVEWVGGDSLEPLNAFAAMWFAWAAFYPDSAVHE